jgi:type II secretory pathway component PulK
MMVVVVGMVTSLSAQRSRSLQRQTASERHELQAFYAAEAGLAHSRHILARAADYHGSTLQIGPASVTTQVRTDPSTPGTWSVVVEARAPAGEHVAAGRCRIEASLRSAESPGSTVRIESWREIR